MRIEFDPITIKKTDIKELEKIVYGSVIAYGKETDTHVELVSIDGASLDQGGEVLTYIYNITN